MIPARPYATLVCPYCQRETPLTYRQFEVIYVQSYTCFGCGGVYKVKGNVRCVL